MANHFWLKLYRLLIIGSDHAPILIDTHTRKINRYHNFKFEAKWFTENNFLDLVRSVWSIYISGGSCAYQLIE